MPVGTATTANATSQVNGLFAGIAGDMLEVEQRLQRELSSRYEQVDRVVRHGYRLGGKRLRPALVLLAGRACGRIDDGHLLLATVVEMIHTATLVHDDVLDEADLRRHEDTVNARWGNETSVLLGDFLFSQAFYLASTIGTAEYCRVIGQTTNRVCEGELLQTLGEQNFEIGEELYLEIIEAKTAELCACCCELGAVRGEASPEVVAAMREYGRSLGIAFQIADDLLDLLGEEEQTGKSLGRDLAKGKLTLPLIRTRDVLVDGNRTKFLADLAAGESAHDRIMRAVHDTESIHYAREAAQRYAEQAIACLEVLPDSEARQTLADVARFTVERHG